MAERHTQENWQHNISSLGATPARNMHVQKSEDTADSPIPARFAYFGMAFSYCMMHQNSYIVLSNGEWEVKFSDRPASKLWLMPHPPLIP
jgi:hypothetical protein